MKPRVSVIIPVLNREKLLLRCLDSIVSQTYRPLEVIIIDNGSTDSTLATAHEWSSGNSASDFEVKVLSESKPGACAARNCGLGVASGEFTLFFDSDDVMRQELITKAVSEFEKCPDAEIVCWQCELHQLDGTVRHSPFNPENAMECHLVNALLRTQGYMAPTVIFREAGGWDESLPGWNDWELGVRLLTRKPKIIPIYDFLVDVFNQEVSITGKNFSSKIGCWEKSLETVRYDIADSTLHDKERLLRIVIYRQIILASSYAAEGNMPAAANLKAMSLQSLRSMSNASLSTKIYEAALNFAYHYTRIGGRGAWRLLRNIL